MSPQLAFPGLEDLAEYRVAKGCYVVPKYAQRALGTDPSELLTRLCKQYPTRGEGDTITRGCVQWVDGDNAALRYRGHALRRTKIWLQRGDPSRGYLRYRYTGWQWRVLPATMDVASCPEVLPVADAYDAWCDGVGAPRANHYIVTRYEDGRASIGWHFDKPDSISPDSLITVVKLGACGRPFALRWRDGEAAPFFDEVLAPGTAVIMTMEANLATQHSVPEVERAGLSGSIVFRTITESFTEAEVAAEMKARGAPF